MTKYIIDTNVWIAASGKALCSVECEEACLELLSSLREFGAVLILDQASFGTDPPGNSVLQELNNNLHEGDYAFELFWKELFHQGKYELIQLQYNDAGAVLPGAMEIYQIEDDGSRYPFEPSDRKWIALHVLDPDHPSIYNATDSDWEKARNDLVRYNIKVRQLCSGRDIP